MWYICYDCGARLTSDVHLCDRCQSLLDNEGELDMPAPAPAAKSTEIVKTTRKPRARAPENESKADKFKRLANHRVPRAIKLMLNIANLGNRSQYDGSDEQRQSIVNALTEALNRVKQRFSDSVPESNLFKL